MERWMADNETLNKKQQQSLLKHINKWSQNTETDRPIVSSRGGATFVYTNKGIFKFHNDNSIYSGVLRIAGKFSSIGDGYKKADHKDFHSIKRLESDPWYVCYCITSYFPFDKTIKVEKSDYSSTVYRLIFSLDKKMYEKRNGKIQFKSDDAKLWHTYINVYSTHRKGEREDILETIIDKELIEEFKNLYPGEVNF